MKHENDNVMRNDPADAIDHTLVKMGAAICHLLGSYFRGEVHGLEKLPDGPALLVGNHNAGITMFEPFLLGTAMFDQRQELIHYLGHDAMMDMPLVGNILTRLGVIRAGHASAADAFDAGRKVMVFPGGNYEAFRPYSQRYVVDFKGRKGFARLALRHAVPIVPVVNIGGHETFFILRRGERLARWTGAKRLFRTDSFPIFIGAPWGVGIGPIFHLPLPAKLLVEVGEPIETAGYAKGAHEDEMHCTKLAREVEARIQTMMNAQAKTRKLPLIG